MVVAPQVHMCHLQKRIHFLLLNLVNYVRLVLQAHLLITMIPVVQNVLLAVLQTVQSRAHCVPLENMSMAIYGRSTARNVLKVDFNQVWKKRRVLPVHMDVHHSLELQYVEPVVLEERTFRKLGVMLMTILVTNVKVDQLHKPEIKNAKVVILAYTSPKAAKVYANHVRKGIFLNLVLVPVRVAVMENFHQKVQAPVQVVLLDSMEKQKDTVKNVL